VFYLYDLPGKGPIVAYDAADKTEARCAAAAILQVLKSYSPFHQIGMRPDGPNEPGFHGWELWMPIDEATLNTLVSECEAVYLQYLA
jgi:hypothetical protein